MLDQQGDHPVATIEANIEPGIEACAEFSRLNTALLSSIASWAMTRDDVAKIFPGCDGRALGTFHTQMNRDLVRVVMLVLSHQAFHTGRAQRFSLRQLALHLDAPRAESLQRSLRKWLLPMVTQAGWVEGFVLTDTWSTEPHEIEITSAGLQAMGAYFTKISGAAPVSSQVVSPLDQGALI